MRAGAWGGPSDRFPDEVGEEVVAVVRGMAEAAVGEGGELRAPELIL